VRDRHGLSYDSLSVGVIAVIEGKIVDANRAGAELLGRTPEQLIGQHFKHRAPA